MTAICRDCDWYAEVDSVERCPACRSPRVVVHAELDRLSVAHIDCDAFYATVEKRDDPSLADRPLIIGGGTRGVVAAACYIARRYGVRSAMPMFKARRLCPHAVVRRPNMEKYSRVGELVRDIMRSVTTAIEPLSIDEAYMDLDPGEEHGADITTSRSLAPPAARLAGALRRIEAEIGITASAGLSYNKFLAKIASDMDKPRGFQVLGRTGIQEFLAPHSVSLVFGVGRATRSRLEADGIHRIKDLQVLDRKTLTARYGSIGERLYDFARGDDPRTIKSRRPTKSISAETTFERDTNDLDLLNAHLVRLCERVCQRLARKSKRASTVVLKLRRTDFSTLTRSKTPGTMLSSTTDVLPIAERLLEEATSERSGYRLLGIGVSGLSDAETDAEEHAELPLELPLGK